MPRRHILTVKKIYERRASAWAYHYENRNAASALCRSGWSGEQISAALKQEYPKPAIQIDGFFLDIPLFVRQEREDRLLKRFRLLKRDLLCQWYWTNTGWLELIRDYQALPDIYEDYYYKYDPEPNDRIILVPMSSKPKKAVDKSPKTVDKSVDKSGTTAVQKVHLPIFELSTVEQ